MLSPRWLVVVGLLTFPSLAHADETAAPTTPGLEVRAISASFSANAAWLQTNDGLYHSHNEGAGFQVAIDLRLSDSLSVGGVGSHTFMESGARLSRFAGEMRYHAVHRRFLEVWGAAELGVAAYDYEPPGPVYDFSDGGGSSPTSPPNLRFAPMGALGAGVDFVPVRYVSIGLEGRVLGAVFGYAQNEPSGLTPGAFLGLTLALHIPTS